MKILIIVSALAAAAATSTLLPLRTATDEVARGKYLVHASGCADCHTPFKLGPDGPVPDDKLAFAGHPQDLQMPPAPALPPGPWLVTVSATNTAWAGPWGVSFTANLTPDTETGIGSWTADTFVAAMRTGRHMGIGRRILPPMPAAAAAQLDDADLRAMFAYLHSLPPVRNRVPEPLAPAAK